MTSNLTVVGTYSWEATQANVDACNSISIDDVSIIAFTLMQILLHFYI